MFSFTLRRLVVALAVALTVSIVSFLLLHLSGDLAIAIAGQEAWPERVLAIRTEYGLDRPLAVQYGEWLWNAVRLDFGRSFYFREDVSKLVAERFPITFTLGLLALGLALAVAIPVVQSIVLILAIIYVGLTLVADLLNGYLDPRLWRT